MKTLLALILLASPAIAQQDLSGTYHGIIASAGSSDGTTVLKTHLSGQTTGAYVFGPPENIEKGKLTNCKLQDRTLRCFWNDAYGKGDFIVRFSETFCAFEGSWYTRARPEAERDIFGGSEWTGQRGQRECPGLGS